MIKNIVQMIVKSLALLLYFLTYLSPRKKSRWVFGEAHGFNNNSKYFFLEVLQEHPDIEAYWIGNSRTVMQLRNRSLPACNRHSLKGIYLCLTAKVYVVSWVTNDISFYLSGGAMVVNLWHGAGMKKFLWLNPYNIQADTSLLKKASHFIRRPHMYFHPRLVLSTSQFYTEEVFSRSFRVPKDHCVEDVYPRVKFMLKSKNEILEYLQQHQYKEQFELNISLSAYNKVVLYAPTFRDSGKDIVELSGIDFNEINELMRKQNALFIVKFHPSNCQSNTVYDGLSNVKFLDRKYDLYTTMPFTDVLISDYSSILSDYLLLDKRIIAFPFDMEQYVAECRELQFDYQSTIEGIPVAYNYMQLKALLSKELPVVPKSLIKRYWQPKEDLFTRIYKTISQ